MRIKLVVVGLMVALALSYSVLADIGIDWTSTGGLFANGGTWLGGPWVGGALAQLIWCADDPTATGNKAWATNPNYLAPGEFLLTSFITSMSTDEQYGMFAGKGGVFTDALVGGDITAGYVYGRVFQDATPNALDYYYQGGVVNRPITPYDPSNPGSIQLSNLTSTPQMLDRQVEPVPEPASMTLALLGLGTLAAARRFRKK